MAWQQNFPSLTDICVWAAVITTARSLYSFFPQRGTAQVSAARRPAHKRQNILNIHRKLFSQKPAYPEL